MAALAAGVLVATLVAVLAGGAGAAPRSAGATPAAGTTSVVVRFISRTTQPRADTPWSYCVLAVAGATVEPLEASVKQRLFDSRGNPIGNVGAANFYGAWCQSIKLPASIRGQAITLETKVQVVKREVIVRTPIRVR